VAFEFASGLLVMYYRDPRTPAEFVEDVRDQAASETSDWPFSLRPLRARWAEVAEAHRSAHHVGPAAISWVEGGYLISILGNGGQQLDEILRFAGGMSVTN